MPTLQMFINLESIMLATFILCINEAIILFLFEV